jgi:hypothetical protein
LCFSNKKVSEEFLDVYSKSSEYELYSYYLDKAGIDYITNKKLDFDKVFDLIKYDVVVPFVGGGSTLSFPDLGLHFFGLESVNFFQDKTNFFQPK